jgi:lipoyl-dependent peroxiredoxin
MSVDVKYRTTASAVGGRDGQAGTEDGKFSVKLSTPKELRWTPLVGQESG